MALDACLAMKEFPSQSFKISGGDSNAFVASSGAQVRDQNQDLYSKDAAVKTPIVSHHLLDGQPLSFVDRNSQAEPFQ